MSWAAAEVIACGPHRVEAFISTVKFAIAADTSGGIVVGTAADIVVGTSVDVVVGTAVDIVGTAAVGAASLTDAASVVGEARVATFAAVCCSVFFAICVAICVAVVATPERTIFIPPRKGRRGGSRLASRTWAQPPTSSRHASKLACPSATCPCATFVS